MLVSLPGVLAAAASIASTSNTALFSQTNGGYSQTSNGEEPKKRPPGMPIIDYRGDGEPRRAIVLMDALCPYHGCYLGQAIMERYRDTAIVTVLSDYLFEYFQQNEKDCPPELKVPPSVEKWKEFLDVEYKTVYCESDSGLADAEALREQLRVDCRDSPVILPARREKDTMLQAARQAGLPIPQQQLCRSEQEAIEFCASLYNQGQTQIVLKPNRGVASEDVHLCATRPDVQQAWQKITSSNVFGTQEKHRDVLVQEYIEGTEYALDVVSKNGQHKVAAVWEYDKRATNDSPFVYFSTKLLDNPPLSESLAQYAERALDSLGICWGIAHVEFIVRGQQVFLVEVNCRQHNMDFLGLVMPALGYNALDMYADALLGTDDAWERYPRVPPQLNCQARMVHLSASQSGRLESIEPLPQNLQSVQNVQIYPTPGAEIQPTTDIRTDVGWVQLVHPDASVVEQDYKKILEWMTTSMLQMEKK